MPERNQYENSPLVCGACADDKENARLIISQIIPDTFKALKTSYPETGEKHKQELQLIRAQLTQEGKSGK